MPEVHAERKYSSFSYYSKNISEKRLNHIDYSNDKMKEIVLRVICLNLKKGYIVLWSIKPIVRHNERKTKAMKYYALIF